MVLTREKILVGFSIFAMGSVIVFTGRLLAEDPCPNITVKTVDCPDKTDTPCGDRPVKLGIPGPCTEEAFIVKPGDFKTQKNGTNETNTQTDGDLQDRVVCRQAFDCVVDPADPTKCKKAGAKPAQDELVSPLEEVPCKM